MGPAAASYLTCAAFSLMFTTLPVACGGSNTTPSGTGGAVGGFVVPSSSGGSDVGGSSGIGSATAGQPQGTGGVSNGNPGGYTSAGGSPGVGGSSFTPRTTVGVANAGGVAAITIGPPHSCALMKSGLVKCWNGSNRYYELGYITPDAGPNLTPMQGITNAVAVGAGFSHTCVVLSDGSVRCCGDNSFHQLGNASITSNTAVAAPVAGISGAVMISAAVYHSCALLASGAIQCWGASSLGTATGILTSGGSDVPVSVTGITNAIAIAAGGNAYREFNCAILSGGAVKCWGDNEYGQISGNSRSSLEPVVVSGLSNATAIATGDAHVCAAASGSVWCWGENSNGQLGDQTTVDRSSPVKVTGLTDIVQVAAGKAHSCAMHSDGTVQCWGYNIGGQLGDGTSVDRAQPVFVQGLSTAAMIGANEGFTCALLTSGEVICWGDGYGYKPEVINGL